MIDLALDGRLFIRNKLDAALQELDILFNTENTELIGYPDFGTVWEQFLWQLNPNDEQIKNYIYQKISTTLFLSQMNVDIDVKVFNGSFRLIYQVIINVYDGIGHSQKREYQFR